MRRLVRVKAGLNKAAAILMVAFTTSVLGGFAPTGADAAVAYPPSQHCGTLKIRSAGPCVRALQRQLDGLGATPSLRIDGYFGSSTLKAVRRFQRLHGLKQDGKVGEQTWKALNKAARHAGRSPWGALFSNAFFLVAIAFLLTIIIVTAMAFAYLKSNSRSRRIRLEVSRRYIALEGENFPSESLVNSVGQIEAARVYAAAAGISSYPRTIQALPEILPSLEA